MALTDRDALLALYRATDGANWGSNENWDTDADLSLWYGVKAVNGRVVSLSLPYNNLQGHIPPQLGDLGALKYLDLSNNKLDGEVPASLGKLGNLRKLDVSWNKLTGMGTGDHAERLLPVLLKCESCWLRGNPWELPPAAVVAAGKDSIRGYYGELRVSRTPPTKMQSLKVVFAGHSGAGKTSLIKTILRGRGELAQGVELETVGVQVSDYISNQVVGRTVKFYDLAGQSDYYGLHQLFMTERAVYVMTWDASKFLRRQEELVKELMGWITALHLRAPHCTVILVGTHSDKIAGGWCAKLLSRLNLVPSLSSVMDDVEATLKTEHEAWKARREVSTDEGLTVESGVILISSSPKAIDTNVSELLKRFESKKGTTSFIPPSWSRALVVLDALKYGLDPLSALTCWEEGRPLPTSGSERTTWVEKSKIIETWLKVHDDLSPDQKAGDPSFAMESAINLREFGGSLLRHEEMVFLDVEEFALRLAPILNHKICDRDEDGRLLFGGKRLDRSWQREASGHLIDKGILHRCFARFLWDEHEHFPEAVFDVLVKLGILLPLGRDHDRREIGQREAREDHNCGQIDAPKVSTVCGRGYLVLMRLPGEVPPAVTRCLQAFEGLTQQWGLVSRWEFHNGSAPHGLVERIIASCHTIGNVVRGTCWRKGSCFVGNDAGKKAGDGPYALMVDFRENTGLENIRTAGTLTVRAFGARDGRAVGGAMRFAISTVWRLFDHFPGLSWEAWVECPNHVGEILYTLPGPRDKRQRIPGQAIVASSSVASCQLCSVTAGLARRLGHVLCPGAPMDAIFRSPAENDGCVGTSSDAERTEAAAKNAKFAEALDNVRRAMVVDDETSRDVPPTRRRLLAALAIGGPLGVIALVGQFWEPFVEMADRWADGDSLDKTLPITLLLALLALVLVIPLLAATFCSPLRRHLRRWLSSRTHQE